MIVRENGTFRHSRAVFGKILTGTLRGKRRLDYRLTDMHGNMLFPLIAWVKIRVA